MKHETRKILIRLSLTAVAFLAMWGLLAITGPSLVEEKAVQDWVAKREWVSLVNPAIRNRLIGYWQPLTALLLTASLFYPRLKIPADYLASLITKQAIVDVTGRWATQELTNPFDKNDRFRLHFDLEVKGDTLLGTIRQSSTTNRYDFKKGILDGNIKSNIISFYISEQAVLKDETVTFKNFYYGSVLKGEIEFTLQSDRPWGFPPQKFIAKRVLFSGSDLPNH